VRVTTAFNHLLRLPGASVRGVRFEPDRVVVTVALRRRRLNNRVRLIIRRAYGFHSAQAALALVLLGCGPITLRLPHETGAG
jgi:hypothetical protein